MVPWDNIQLSRRFCIIALTFLFCAGCCFSSEPSASFPDEKYTRQSALSMIKASRGVLAPVYGPLAEQIVADFDLDKKTGIGIDLGSGPGTLIIELCKRTKLHWINADINPHFFVYFFRSAQEHGFGHRVSAVFTDAHSLAFRDNYADIIISRGSFHFWKDKVKAFGEIYRVLKPGAMAYIGRGFPKNLPVGIAKKIRTQQGKKMNYDVEKTANELYQIMIDLGIKNYYIHKPKPASSEEVNYGIWIEFHKPGG
jgi:SAM-dependent methyltransferase